MFQENDKCALHILSSTSRQSVEQLDVNQEVVGLSPICHHLFELSIIDVSYKKREG